MKYRRGIAFILLISIFFVPAACGKKAPPFLTAKDIPLGVDQLNAQWKEGAFQLQGIIVGYEGEIDDPSTISGCSVFYAHYPLDNSPCEDCPIDYRLLKKIEGRVIKEGQFFCEVFEKKESGIYFFRVRLMGQKGAFGPPSNRAKLVVEEK